MSLNTETKKYLLEYIAAHVADEEWHVDFFSFINDPILAKRLGEEFISTRYIYKLLESLGAEEWLLRAQIRIQVFSYASIYEAVLHHLLFSTFKDRSEVTALTEFPTKKRISIPSANMNVLCKYLEHDGKTIIPTYETIGRTDESKVRFDKKAETAQLLGLIEPWLTEELVEFYEARNAIHIHAEIKKSLDYQIGLSKRAYLRMQPFQEQLVLKLQDLGLYVPPVKSP